MANPVFQRELVAHLRSARSFVLQAVFVLLLGSLVAVAWPTEGRLSLSNPEQARRLIDLFFIGQFLFASLTTPVFAAGALTGEKGARRTKCCWPRRSSPNRSYAASGERRCFLPCC
ncbi:MAG: hypothetical protein QM775_23710 [Pirellulales bacterium]